MRVQITDTTALKRIDPILFRRLLVEHGGKHQGRDRWFLGGVCYDLNAILSSNQRRSRAISLLATSLELSELDVLSRLAGYRVFIYDRQIKIKGTALSWARSLAASGYLDASVIPEKVYYELLASGVAEVVIGDSDSEKLMRLTAFAINEKIVPTKKTAKRLKSKKGP